MRITRLLVPVVFVAAALGAAEVSESERAAVTSVGQEASGILMKSLKAALTTAMRDGGPAHAVGFCNEQALVLTGEVQQKLGGLAIKRTSHRFRNPANAPDGRESQVLDLFERAAPSERPEPVVEKFRRGDQLVYRYYEPVYSGALCLTCHGENIPGEVQTILNERYPGDRATGYKDGDFRGVIRVEIPEERLAK